MPDYNIAELEPATGLFRYTRNSFASAGQSSYDTPPTQDPDVFEVMTNTLPVVTDQLQRRWGTLPLLSWAAGGQLPLRLAEYRVTANTTRGIVTADTKTATLYDEATLKATVNPLFTYQNTLNAPRFLTSRSYLYTGNGTDMYKSTGLAGAPQQNWGIAISAGTTVGYGPNNPTVQTSAGWANPNNILVRDGVFTTFDLTRNDPYADIIYPQSYGFTVSPDIQILGIQVDLYGYTVASQAALLGVTLYRNNGQGVPVAYKTTVLPSANGKVTLGGPTDLWSTSWVPTDFGGSGVTGFKVGLNSLSNPLPDGTMYLDAAQVTLYYISPFTFTINSTGNVTLTGGRRYYIVYKNNNVNHLSDLSAPTITTGPLTSKSINLQSLPISTDPQVTNRVILATPDGGDLTKLYELVTLDNTVTTYTDNTPENALLLHNIYLETDSYGIEHGCSGNTPPPPTNVFVKHLGRVYFLVNNSTLYFSKNDDEMTTSTGLICGRYEESVPGDYQMDISSEAEIGSTLFSDGSILYIATEKQIRRLYGDGPSNFQTPQIHFTEVGVMSPELLQTVYVEGRPSGVVWVTPDLKVIGSDFLFYQNIGKPIQDVLNTINTSVVRTVAQSQFFAQGAFQFFVLAVPTGTSTVVNTILVYDLVKKKWHNWTLPPAITVQSILTNITVNGTPRLLLGGYYSSAKTPYIWQLSPNMAIDQIYNAGQPPDQFNSTPITAQVRSTWQTFGDVNLRKDFDEIEVFTRDPNLTLTLEGASNSNEFANPTQIFSNMPLRVSAFGEYKWYMAAQPTVDRFYRFTYTSTFNDRSFIDGYRMDIIPEHRF